MAVDRPISISIHEAANVLATGLSNLMLMTSHYDVTNARVLCRKGHFFH